MNKAGKVIIGAAAVALVALVAVRMTKKEPPMEAVPDPTVQTAFPETGTIELKTGLTGTVEPADVVYVIPGGAGEVTEVSVSVGQQVEKDQELFRIDNKQLDQARISLDSAQVSLEDARTNLGRMQVLYETGDISAQSYEQVVSAARLAQLQYDSAKLNYDTQLENSVVTAPIAGLLESFDVEVHDMVSGGNYVAVISGDGSRSVSFSVTERVMKGLAAGDPLTVEKNGTEYHGTITEISTMVDPGSGLFKVKAALEGADGLATGSSVKLYVTAQKAENVMTVPADCVNYSGGEAFVYTYDEATGTAHKVPIEQGLIDSEKIEVRSGLEYEDQVIVTWTRELYEGAAVQAAAAGEAESGETSGETESGETAENHGGQQ